MKNDSSYYQNQFLENIFKNIRSLSQMELDNDDMSEIEESSNKFTDILVMDYLKFEGTNPEIVKSELSRILSTIKIILTSIEKGFEKSNSKLDDIFKKIKGFEKFHENYPHYVKLNHPEEGLKFYKKLTKDEYNYTELSKLLGGSRQLISRRHEKGYFGVYKKGKISKEKVYKYYITELIKK